jgi:transposase
MPNNNKEQYFFSDQTYICFLTACRSAIEMAKIPLYSSPYSRRDYNQHQLISLLLLKEFIGQGYRELIKLTEISEILQESLGLAKIPHYSTLCKFVSRWDSSSLNQIFKKTCNLMSIVDDHVTIAAIDSTGFVTDSSSYYYSARTEKLRKDFIKVTISVNTKNLSILAIKTTNSRCHDSKVAIPVLRASHKAKKADVYVMDKAYDSETIHDFIHNELNSDAIIPTRNWNASYVSGPYRQRMAQGFDREIYHQRNIVETVFSVIKRKFGDKINARKYHTKLKEIKLKCIVYQLDRFLKYQRVFNVL